MINLQGVVTNPSLKEKDKLEKTPKDAANKGQKDYQLPPKKLEKNPDLENVDLKLKFKNLAAKILLSIDPKRLENSSLLRPNPKIFASSNVANDLFLILGEIKDKPAYKELFKKLEAMQDSFEDIKSLDEMVKLAKNLLKTPDSELSLKQIQKKNELLSLLSKDESLPFEKRLKKAVSLLKENSLGEFFKNSGVFFESKLKNALVPDKLPREFYKLFSAIKGLNNELLSEDIKTLGEQGLPLKESLNKLKAILKHHDKLQDPLIKESSFKALFKLGRQLENYKTYLLTTKNIDSDKLVNIAKFIDSKLHKMASEINKEISRPQNIAIQDTSVLKRLNEALKALSNELKTQGNEALKEPLKEALNELKSDPQEASKKELTSKQNELKEGEKDNLEKNLKAETKENLKTDLKESLKEQKLTTSEQDSLKTALKKQILEELAKNSKQNNQNSVVKDELLADIKQLSKAISKDGLLDLASLRKPRKNALRQKIIQNTQEAKSTLTKGLEAGHSVSEKAAIVEANIAKLLPAKAMNKAATLLNANPDEQSVAKLVKSIAKNLAKSLVVEDKTAVKELVKQALPKLANLSFENDELGVKLAALTKELSHTSVKVKEALNALDAKGVEAALKHEDIKRLGKDLQNAIKSLDEIVPKKASELSASLKDDLKPSLMQAASIAKDIGDESVLNQANKLLSQIELNQLLSLANSSISTFLPFFWDDLRGQNVVFKRGKKDKYFASINLEFKTLGQLNVLLSLNHEKYIDINMMIEDDDFRKKLYENAHLLKRSLSKAGLISANFFISTLPKNDFELSSVYDEMSVDLDKRI